MTSANSMQTTFQGSDQAARVISFTQTREGSTTQPAPFLDNLDHLQALEQEAKLILARAMLRRHRQPDGREPAQPGDLDQLFPFIPERASLDDVEALCSALAVENRLREAESRRLGRTLKFCDFSEQHGLAPLEQRVLLLLLMNFTAPAFALLFNRCEFEDRRYSGGMEIGSILAILCAGFRDQLEARRYFSVNATLMKEEILVMFGQVRETDNILDETVYLHERIARYILGDDNQYSSAARFLRRERCSVKVEQVILPGQVKEETLALVDRYLTGRASGRFDEFDRFFGYGTGLVLMFHGPSGTGKTMLAKAIATHCDRELISLCVPDMREIRMSEDEILAGLFREASLQNGIVLLDECDDLFLDNSSASRALLIEIEKARCVVILATNKPVNMDPAMERRITRKVLFRLPGPELRLKMWRSLIPINVRLSEDVDLAELAGRFRLSGGLIKNAVMTAISLALPESEGTPELTAALLERSASLQSEQLTDLGGVCQVYAPKREIDSLTVADGQQEALRNTVLAWQRVRDEGLGMNVLVTSSSIETGKEVCEALAAACRLNVRCFDLNRVLSLSEADKVIHPVTQQKVSPLRYTFSSGPGDAAMTMIVDHDGDVAAVIDEGLDESKNGKAVFLRELLSELRGHAGLFCLVTARPQHGAPPLEFNVCCDLEYPSSHCQITLWRERLAVEGDHVAELQELVQRFPMHLTDIDYYSRQAAIRAIIAGKEGKPTVAAAEVIGRYRQTKEIPLLFGRGHHFNREGA